MLVVITQALYAQNSNIVLSTSQVAQKFVKIYITAPRLARLDKLRRMQCNRFACLIVFTKRVILVFLYIVMHKDALSLKQRSSTIGGNVLANRSRCTVKSLFFSNGFFPSLPLVFLQLLYIETFLSLWSFFFLANCESACARERVELCK